MEIKEIEIYLEQVRNSIFNITDADEFIEALRQQLYDYASDYPDLSLEALYHEFGDPGTVAQEFLEDKPDIHPKQIAKEKKKSRIKTAVIIILVVIVIAAAVRLLDLYFNTTQTMATDVIVIHENEEEKGDSQ